MATIIRMMLGSGHAFCRCAMTAPMSLFYIFGRNINDSYYYCCQGDRARHIYVVLLLMKELWMKELWMEASTLKNPKFIPIRQLHSKLYNRLKFR